MLRIPSRLWGHPDPTLLEHRIQVQALLKSDPDTTKILGSETLTETMSMKYYVFIRVLILVGNSEVVAHLCRKVDLF